MCDVENKILIINGVNTHIKGSGYYALNHWLCSMNKFGVDYILFNTVPKLISQKDRLFLKIALFFYFFPGSFFRVVRVPLFEILYKLSLVTLLKFIYYLMKKNMGSVIFSHHSSFYLMLLINKSKRILIIHDLLYIRSKSFGLPRWINKITFAIELEIYKRCKLICLLSYHEYKLLSKFINVRMSLISVCEETLSVSEYVPNKEIALVSDWRRYENRHGAISFFSKQKVKSNNKIKIYVYGYGSSILVSHLRKLTDLNIIFIDKGSYSQYDEISPSFILVCIEKGAGIKLKLIEAICHKKYVLGTRPAFIGVPPKLLNNVSEKIETIDECFTRINKLNLQQGIFNNFIKDYAATYKNIGSVLKYEIHSR